MTDCPHSSDRTSSGPLTGRESDYDVRDRLICVVETYDGDSDICTIFPRIESETTTVTTWISAEEGSFVPLEEVR